METQIKESLIALLAGIKVADGNAIVDRTAQLDEIVAKHGDRLHPQLSHFLERRSYAKALQFLGGDAAIPSGSCASRS